MANGHRLNDISNPSVRDDAFCNMLDVVDFISVSRVTVYSWVKRGLFPKPCDLPKAPRTRPCLLWRVGDIRDWARKVGMLRDIEAPVEDDRQLELPLDDEVL